MLLLTILSAALQIDLSPNLLRGQDSNSCLARPDCRMIDCSVPIRRSDGGRDVVDYDGGRDVVDYVELLIFPQALHYPTNG
jgi:hypothetical protein